MQLVLHTGAHYTDDDRLLKCLLRNKDGFAAQGIAVPGPGRYRSLLRSTLNAMRKGPPQPDAREVLLDAFLDDAQADRLILSNAHFFGAPRAAVRAGTLYPMAAERLIHFSQLFPVDQIEIFMAIRNPATFLPEVFEQSPKAEFERFLGGADIRSVRWSDTIRQMRAALPNAAITIWCNEDTPLIWSEIIRDIAGLDYAQPIIGSHDLLAEIMSADGLARFEHYLTTHPGMTEMQKRRVIAAFLDKFALEDELEHEVDLPGWTHDLVDEVTELYDADVYEIERIAGVDLIAP